jgi:uncharacterized protein YhhL (DUF1145 family)
MDAETVINTNAKLLEALVRLSVNLVALLIIIRFLYQRYQRKNEHKFSFFLMGIMIFIICILLKNVEIQMGMALGLFAIFSIVRFRTLNMTTKDMAYLFAVIGVSAINALFDFPNPVRGTIMVNSIVILAIFLLEISSLTGNMVSDKDSSKKDKKKSKNKDKKKSKKNKSGNSHQILYDKLELLSPDRREDLIKDISRRTGIKIRKIEIRKIDMVQGNAILKVFLQEEVSEPDNDSGSPF